MRGKLKRLAEQWVLTGITPAHAGKTIPRNIKFIRFEDHPRACGENAIFRTTINISWGSPPRMRGKPSLSILEGCLHRITPAHAGKTKAVFLAIRVDEDHPRACGENKLIYLKFQFAAGSPPRMRGKRTDTMKFNYIKRITPAHAGKTLKIKMLLTKVRDHPRACGENLKSFTHSSATVGSPPRMRGKLLLFLSGFVIARITPAHAGKTGTWNIHSKGEKDHPRACGENVSRGAVGLNLPGSPPRMRGKRFHGM